MDNEMMWRENIEWQNMWWESARDVKIKRIALLGDSVTRAYRSRLNKKLEGKYVVDICASSSQIIDSLLWKEYRFFFECNEWNYSKIIMQGGGQHGHARKCCSDEQYSAIFKNGYRELVSNIISYCKDILVVSYTPCKEDSLSKWDNEKNRELEKRNQMAREVAEEFNLPYIDLWTELIHARYEFEDPVHVKSEGNDFIAAYLCKYI